MKKLFFFIGVFMCLYGQTAIADVHVFTNPHLVRPDGIYEGKITRVIFYSTKKIGVFLKNPSDVGIGVEFTEDDAFFGASLASCVSCDANIARKSDGQYGFSVNSWGSHKQDQ